MNSNSSIARTCQKDLKKRGWAQLLSIGRTSGSERLHCCSAASGQSTDAVELTVSATSRSLSCLAKARVADGS